MHPEKKDRALSNFGDSVRFERRWIEPGSERRSVIGNDPRTGLRTVFQRPLENDFDSLFQHLLANLPMHDVAAATVENRAQVVENPGNIDVGNIDVPVFACGRLGP